MDELIDQLGDRFVALEWWDRKRWVAYGTPIYPHGIMSDQGVFRVEGSTKEEALNNLIKRYEDTLPS